MNLSSFVMEGKRLLYYSEASFVLQYLLTNVKFFIRLSSCSQFSAGDLSCRVKTIIAQFTTTKCNYLYFSANVGFQSFIKHYAVTGRKSLTERLKIRKSLGTHSYFTKKMQLLQSSAWSTLHICKVINTCYISPQLLACTYRFPPAPPSVLVSV